MLYRSEEHVSFVRFAPNRPQIICALHVLATDAISICYARCSGDRETVLSRHLCLLRRQAMVVARSWKKFKPCYPRWGFAAVGIIPPSCFGRTLSQTLLPVMAGCPY